MSNIYGGIVQMELILSIFTRTSIFLPQRPGVLSGGSDVDDQAVAQHGHDPEDDGDNRRGPDSMKLYVTCKSKT